MKQLLSEVGVLLPRSCVMALELREKMDQAGVVGLMDMVWREMASVMGSWYSEEL